MTFSAQRAVTRLGRLQATRPWRVLLVALVLTIGAALEARSLTLRTDFEALLSENHPASREMRRVLDRTGVGSSVFVVLRGAPRATLRSCGDALAKRIADAGGSEIAFAQSGVHAGRAFVFARAGLFAEERELARLEHDIEERWQEQAFGDLGRLDDDEPAPLEAASIRRRLEPPGGLASRFPDGYHETADGRALVVVVRTRVPPGHLTRAEAVLSTVSAAVAGARSEPVCADVEAELAGDLASGADEYRVVKDDVTRIGALGVALVLGVVVAFFRRVRLVAALVAALAVGVLWTFGLASLAVGHLNVATGFLVSIIAGNGLNTGIVYAARYLEARRTCDPNEAIVVAHVETHRATLAASGAAAAGYAAVAIVGLRGLQEFAVVGASGVLACWLATVLVLPIALLAAERVRSLAPISARYPLGERLVKLVSARRRTILVVAIVSAALGAIATADWVRKDPLEYDVRRLRVDRRLDPRRVEATRTAEEVLGLLEDGAVIACETPEEAEEVARILARRRRQTATPAFEAAHTLGELVAPDQPLKIPRLVAVQKLVVRAHRRGVLPDTEWKALEPFLPPDGLVPYAAADIPADAARPFVESDGTRGRLVLVEPTRSESMNDLRYLTRFAREVREVRLAGGETRRATGRALFYAELVEGVVGSMAAAIALSIATTAAGVFLLFTFARASSAGPRALAGPLLVLASLVVAVSWLGLGLRLSGVHLNVFNFIALPITFGIGVDYAMNVLQRIQRERSVERGLAAVAGPVAVCSLTTTLGYVALLASVNPAVRSLGWVACAGELCCLFTALVVLPAVATPGR